MELAQLLHVGRIRIKGALESWVRRGLEEWVRRGLEELGIETINLSNEVALTAYNLRGDFHKDPADRVIVATAIHHGLTLCTADNRILAYPNAITIDASK